MTATLEKLRRKRLDPKNPTGCLWRTFQRGVVAGRIALPPPWEYPADVVTNARRTSVEFTSRRVRDDWNGGYKTRWDAVDAAPREAPVIGAWPADGRVQLREEGAGDWLLLKHPAAALTDAEDDEDYTLGPWYVMFYPPGAHRPDESGEDANVVQFAQVLSVIGCPGALGEGNYTHPNVSHGGDLCLGRSDYLTARGQRVNVGWSPTFKAMLDDRDWFGLLFAMHEFLTNWSTDAFTYPSRIAGRVRRTCQWPLGCDTSWRTSADSDDGDDRYCEAHAEVDCERCDDTIETNENGINTWNWRERVGQPDVHAAVCERCYRELFEHARQYRYHDEPRPWLPRRITRDDRGVAILPDGWEAADRERRRAIRERMAQERRERIERERQAQAARERLNAAYFAHLRTTEDIFTTAVRYDPWDYIYRQANRLSPNCGSDALDEAYRIVVSRIHERRRNQEREAQVQATATTATPIFSASTNTLDLNAFSTATAANVGTIGQAITAEDVQRAVDQINALGPDTMILETVDDTGVTITTEQDAQEPGR